MGWGWIRNSTAPEAGNDLTDQPFGNSAAGAGNYSTGTTATVERSECKTEEVEPGIFIRKCDKSEKVFRHSLWKPFEVVQVQSNEEHTVEDVTHQMVRKSALPDEFEETISLTFPGLYSNLDAIKRHFLGGMKSFFEAAEEMTGSLFDFDVMEEHHPSTKRGIPFESHPKVKEQPNNKNAPRRPHSSGENDPSGLSKDV